MAKQAQTPDGRRTSRRRIAGWSIAAFLLLLPLVAMQFTGEVDWDETDFLFAAALIGGVGIALELTIRMTRNTAYRAAIGIALAAMFLLIWINAAVGIIGSEDNPLNLLYAGVLAVALAAAVGAGFRPNGMARAMIAAAAAQALVAVIALVAGEHRTPTSSMAEIVVLNGFFTGLWLGSALLFRIAARERTFAGPGL